MESAMLVRTLDGAWERLQPQMSVPDGGLTEIFGSDLGPVLGHDQPLLVVAVSPNLPSGRPDAICVTPTGDVALVTLSVGQGDPATLATLLAHAGSLQAMTYADLESAGTFDRKAGDGSLAGYVEATAKSPEFHRSTFEATVAEGLSTGRFQLVAVVSKAPETLTQSMRFLNQSGAADIGCFEFASYSSSSVTALQVNPLEVGQQRKAVVMQMTAAGLVAAAERNNGPDQARLITQLQKYCAGAFDEVTYDGDASLATMCTWVKTAMGKSRFLTGGSDGTIVIHFDELAAIDRDWTVRAELVQGLNRLLGAEVGDARKIKEVVMNVNEHLNDATLMELLTEILSDSLSVLRGTAGSSSSESQQTASAAA